MPIPTDFFPSVIVRFMCWFMNPIPHHVAVQLVCGPEFALATDRYWHHPTYETDVRCPRHTAMLLFLLNQPNVRDHMTMQNGGFYTWVLRAMGFPGFSEEDFTVDDATVHHAFHTRFGSWRLPAEVRSALDGRTDPAALTPLLRDMFHWLIDHHRKPMCRPVAVHVGWDDTIRAFLTRYGVLPHAVALQFCLTPEEWQDTTAVMEYLNAAKSDDHLHSILHWIRQSAGWHVTATGTGRMYLLGLHHRQRLLSWDCLPYAVALRISIGDHERAMADWLAHELRAHHPDIMDMVEKRKSDCRQCRHLGDRQIWHWLVRSVGRAGCNTGFRTHRLHRLFHRRFGSWRISDEVVTRLDHRSGAHGLPPVLGEMYLWVVEHNAYKHWDCALT